MRLIRFSFLLIFIALFVTNILFAQAYNNPESVVYDPTNDCYYVSNKGDGKIIKVDANDTNTKSILNSNLTSVRGLCLIGNVLVAAANEGVVFIALPSGTITQTVVIAGMGFLNDITWDNTQYVFVSDTGTGNIYKIKTDDYSFSTLSTGINSPNGLFYDGDNNRLINVPWIPNAPILAISLSDGSVTPLKETILTQPDGIARDMFGNYYISYWGENSVYKFKNDFSGDPELVSSQHAGPADIFFRTLTATGKVNTMQDSKDNTGILIVPNFNNNTVEFNKLTNLSSVETDLTIPEKFQLHQNFPNPFNPSTTIFYDVSKESNVKISVFDLLGREVVTLVDQIKPQGSGSVIWDGRDFVGDLVNAGVYIYKLNVGTFSQTKKMVLLK